MFTEKCFQFFSMFETFHSKVLGKKKIRPNNKFQQQVNCKRKSQVEQPHYKHSNNFEKIKDDHI